MLIVVGCVWSINSYLMRRQRLREALDLLYEEAAAPLFDPVQDQEGGHGDEPPSYQAIIEQDDKELPTYSCAVKSNV